MYWQPGPDRSLQAWETKNVITVTEEWDNAAAQKISEEQTAENEEQLNKTLVKTSVLNLTDENLASVSRRGDSGSDENAATENEKGTHLNKNPSSVSVEQKF